MQTQIYSVNSLALDYWRANVAICLWLILLCLSLLLINRSDIVRRRFIETHIYFFGYILMWVGFGGVIQFLLILFHVINPSQPPTTP